MPLYSLLLKLTWASHRWQKKGPHLCAAVAQEDHHRRPALVKQLRQVSLQGWPPWEKHYRARMASMGKTLQGTEVL